MITARHAQGVHPGAIVVANPLPPDEQLDPALHDRVLAAGLAGLAREGITRQGRHAVPAGPLPRETDGASLDVNIRIILRNAALAARIASAHAVTTTPTAAGL